MKIVITSDCFMPRWDGIARFLSLLLPELSNHEVVVFAPKFEGEVPVYKNVNIVRFPLFKFRFGDIYFSKPNKRVMSKAIKEADVVFNQTIGPIGSAAIRLAQKHHVPLLSYVHSIEWELTERAVRFGQKLIRLCVKLYARWLYNKCSLLLVPSKHVADELSDNKIMVRKELVPLGIPDIFAPTNKAKAKRAINLDDAVVIGFCGRIAREKDLPTLYQAFDAIHRQFPQTKLLIVGEGLEHELFEQEGVVRVGKQNNVAPFLNAMDIFVMPSLTETSSLATMEAMAAQLAVVATPVGSIREYIVHGKNGLLFARKDVAELAEHLAFLIQHPKERKRLGKAARVTIMASHSWGKTAARIKELLTP